MIGCLSTQALAFLAVFVYATHATQAIAFEWKPGLSVVDSLTCVAKHIHVVCQLNNQMKKTLIEFEPTPYWCCKSK